MNATDEQDSEYKMYGEIFRAVYETPSLASFFIMSPCSIYLLENPQFEADINSTFHSSFNLIVDVLILGSN